MKTTDINGKNNVRLQVNTTTPVAMCKESPPRQEHPGRSHLRRDGQRADGNRRHSKKADDTYNDGKVYLSWNVLNETGRVFQRPFMFVIGVKEKTADDKESEWITKGKNTHSIVPFEGLRPTSAYKVRVTTVSVEGACGAPIESDWIKPLSEGELGSRPTAVRVVRQFLGDGSMSAIVEWSVKQDASCFYRLYWMAPESPNYHQRDISLQPGFQHRIDNLQFSSNYTLNLSAYDRSFQHNTRSASSWFMTPSCLQATGYNFSLCAPSEPRNVRYTLLDPCAEPGNNTCQVHLWWMSPSNTSEDNLVDNYVLEWRKNPFLDRSQHVAPHHEATIVGGNVTDAVIEGLHTGTRYKITIRAVSAGRSGASAMLTVSTSGTKIMKINNGLHTADENDGVSNNGDLLYLISIPIGFLLVLGPLILGIWLCRKRERKQRFNAKWNAKEEVNPLYNRQLMGDDDAGVTFIDEYEIDYNRLLMMKTLGEGAFGKVVKAEMLPSSGSRASGTIVAVKMLKAHHGPDDSRNLFLEIEAMKMLGRFPHIVSILGCCTVGNHLCLVMDYCALGDLRNHLRNMRLRRNYTHGKEWSNPQSDSGITRHSCNFERSLQSGGYSSLTSGDFSKSVTSKDGERRSFQDLNQDQADDLPDENGEDVLTNTQLLSYARQIVLGMEYLAQRKFVHRDLAARNILMFDMKLLKIADFGLSRDIYENSIYQPTSARKLPYKWMPLEAIFDQVFTIKSDVWSFGIVLWEIVTLGGCPYPGINSKDLFKMLKDGYRMEKPENCENQLYNIMLGCWNSEPRKRPSFSILKVRIETLLEATQPYIDLNVNVKSDYYQQDSSETDDICVPNGEEFLSALHNSEQTNEPFEDIGSSCNMMQKFVPSTTNSSQNAMNKEDNVYNIMIPNKPNTLKQENSELLPFLKTVNGTGLWVSKEIDIKESNLGPDQRVKCSSLENHENVYQSETKNNCLSPKRGTQTMSDPLLSGTKRGTQTMSDPLLSGTSARPKNSIMVGLLQLLDSVGWGQKLAEQVNATSSSSLLELKEVGGDDSQHNQLLPRCTSMVDCQRSGI